jgi:hypothetical protein
MIFLFFLLHVDRVIYMTGAKINYLDLFLNLYLYFVYLPVLAGPRYLGERRALCEGARREGTTRCPPALRSTAK